MVRHAVIAGASMSKVAKLAVVFFFFFLVGWLYIHTGQLPGGARHLERQLAEDIQLSLQETGHSAWALVEMRGRVAHVSGVAPNEAARMEALGAIKSAACCDGVARVADKTDLLQVVDPYLFEARLDEDGLHLSGYAPDRDARAEIENRVVRLFDVQTRANERRTGEVHAGAMEIASGAPPGANWIHAIEFGVSQLLRLDHGVLRIEGEDMTLFGVAPNPQVRAAVARQLLQAPAPFRGRAAVERTSRSTQAPADDSGAEDGGANEEGVDEGSALDDTDVDDAPLDDALPDSGADPASSLSDDVAVPVPAPLEAPESEGLALEVSEPEVQAPPIARDVCQADFDALLSEEAVQFSFGDADISDASASLLDAISEVALRCSHYSLRVKGHTDSTGRASYNRRLSRSRAQAVMDFLATRGVELSQLSAQGFGADAPIANNRTVEGRRRNRRIEIEVIE